jgi:asparagine synthetase B (glutamine-hydrolysing)
MLLGAEQHGRQAGRLAPAHGEVPAAESNDARTLTPPSLKHLCEVSELLYCMLQINMADKPDGMHPRMEKYLLRKAFDRPDSPYLPESVLWRQKEQFSDGVGYDWVDRLRDYSHEVCFPDTAV